MCYPILALHGRHCVSSASRNTSCEAMMGAGSCVLPLACPPPCEQISTKELDDLQLRHVSTQLSTKPREVLHVKSVKSEASNFSRSATELSPMDTEPEPPDEEVPCDQNSLVSCNVDDLLPPLPSEAFRNGEMVLYWSRSLQQCIAAVIVGRGTFCHLAEASPK